MYSKCRHVLPSILASPPDGAAVIEGTIAMFTVGMQGEKLIFLQLKLFLACFIKCIYMGNEYMDILCIKKYILYFKNYVFIFFYHIARIVLNID